MKKITIILIIGILFVFVILFLIFGNTNMEYPENEWHSRHDCKILHLLYMASALNVYSDLHDGEMPKDLYVLVEEDILNKSHLICPSQYSRVKNSGFLEDNCPLYISSYRLVISNTKYDDIPEGTVVVEEFDGNHPASKVGKSQYPSGHYGLVKTTGVLKVVFFKDNNENTLKREDKKDAIDSDEENDRENGDRFNE